MFHQTFVFRITNMRAILTDDIRPPEAGQIKKINKNLKSGRKATKESVFIRKIRIIRIPLRGA